MSPKIEVLATWGEILRSRFTRALNVWSNYPTIDLGAVLIPFVIHIYLAYRHGINNILLSADQGQRLATYAAGAGIMSLIAGFAGTAIAQYGSSSGPIVTALRATHGRAIRTNWLNITAWLLLGALLCIIAMMIDSSASPRGSDWLFEFAILVALMKFLRLLFLFSLVLTAVDGDGSASTRPRKAIRLKSGR